MNSPTHHGQLICQTLPVCGGEKGAGGKVSETEGYYINITEMSKIGSGTYKGNLMI